MARARNIGNVYAELSVRDKMTHGIKKAQGSLSKFGTRLTKIGAGFALALPAAAFAGLTASMKSAINAGGKLSDMMARTGAGGEGLFLLQRAFENTGMAADRVPDVLNRMQKALAGVSATGKAINTRVWQDLGLSKVELQGMDAVKAFQKVSSAISGIQDPSQRAALAMEIFGRSGAQLLPLMTDAERVFEMAAKQVGGLGKTLADNADALDRVSDSMGAVGIKFQQIGAEVAVSILPTLEKIADHVDSMDLSGVTSQAIEFASALKDAAGYALDIASELPGIKQLVAVGGAAGGAAERAIAWAAGFNPEEGTALDSPGSIRGDQFSPMFKAGMMIEGVAEAALAAIPKPYSDPEQTVAKGVPFMLREFGRQEREAPGGIPFFDALNDIVKDVKFGGINFDRDEEEPDIFTPEFWRQTMHEVNDMQRRGLGFGGESIAKEANKQVDLLTQIRDTLRAASLNEGLNWQ